MTEPYHEVVVEGPVLLVKGFLAGILMREGLGADEVLFAEEHNVRCENLMEQVAEWMRLHRHVSHLLVPARLHGDVKRLLERAQEQLGLKIVRDRPIRSASFEFYYRAFTRGHFNELRDLFDKAPGAVRITDHEPTETFDPDAAGTELYSSVHAYEAKGNGVAIGDFDDILQLHCRAGEQQLVTVSRIDLHHPDD